MDEPERPESFFRRFLWKNSGLLCVVTLLTLPIILGVAIGYVIVLAVVTSYRKISGTKSREEKENEAKKRIRIILGHDLLESAFTKPVRVHGHENQGRMIPLTRYGSWNKNDVPEHSREQSESEIDSTYEQDEEEPKKSEEIEPNTTVNHNEVAEDTGVDKSPGASSVPADRDNSRAASASSEYYSTASEMDDTSCPAPDRVDETSTDPPVSPVENKVATVEAAPGVTEVGGVEHKLTDQEVAGEQSATVIPKNAQSSSPKMATGSLGKLKYSIEYSKETSQLQVTILKAIHLPVVTGGLAPSTYVKLSLLPQRFCWQRTKEVVENINPVYNETFVISGFSHDKMAAYTLLICVINATSQWQGHYGDHVIGEVYVPLSHVTKHVDNKEKVLCEWNELRPKLMEFSGLTKCGKINLSLCYRPISGRLIVTIKKTRDLKCENKEKCDPYVKLAVYCDGARVGRGATRVKRKVANPVFNEKFNFDLTSDQIAYTTVVIKVLNNMENNHACLGATLIGFESSGNGQEHWLCMMECLSQHVDAWHCLYV